MINCAPHFVKAQTKLNENLHFRTLLPWAQKNCGQLQAIAKSKYSPGTGCYWTLLNARVNPFTRSVNNPRPVCSRYLHFLNGCCKLLNHSEECQIDKFVSKKDKHEPYERETSHACFPGEDKPQIYKWMPAHINWVIAVLGTTLIL